MRSWCAGYFDHPFRKQGSLRRSDVLGRRSEQESHNRTACFGTDNLSRIGGWRGTALAAPGVDGQRVTLRHVSSRPSPNRTGTFQRIRLSREMAPPVSGLSPLRVHGLHRALWVLSILPCGPSPCPGHYPRRLSTTTARSP